MIKLSTRVFAWVCIVLIAVPMVLLVPAVRDNAKQLPYLLAIALLELAWVMLIVRPRIGWSMVMPLQVALMGGFVYSLAEAPGIHAEDPIACLLSAAVLALPVLVLVLDSPWRWERMARQAETSDVDSAEPTPGSRPTIRLCTRVVAWLGIIVVAVQAVESMVFSWDSAGEIFEHILLILILWGWIALLLIPRIGWWSLVPLYACQTVYTVTRFLIQTYSLYPPDDLAVQEAVAIIITSVIPLAFLALDSPCRWRGVRGGRSVN